MTRRGVFGFLGAGAASVLGGCSSAESASIPAFVQAMMDADVPDDGRIHVEQRGRIRISPASLQCIAPARINDGLAQLDVRFAGIGLRDVYTALGQPDYINGSSRHGQLGDRCEDNGENQVVQWVLTSNRNGEPYRLALAIWQGSDNYWIGQVIRSGNRPEIKDFPPYRVGPRSRSKVSVEVDRKELSSLFVKYFTSGAKGEAL